MTDAALLEIFRVSTLDQLARAEAAVLALERASPEEGVPAMEAVFRCVHTIKGDAATLQFDGLAECCHELETALDGLRGMGANPAPEVIGGLLAAIDCLRDGLDDPASSFTPGIPGALEPIESLKALLVPQSPTPTGAQPPQCAIPESAQPNTGADAPELGYSVRAAHLDTLLENLSELMTTREGLAALARSEGRFDYLHFAVELERQLAQLGQSILSMRLLSLQAVIPKYRRLVRDLAAQSGKEIDFQVSGEMFELDKTLIEKLNTPLVHLLRNAVRHGVESPDERLRTGKPATGVIRLDAWQDGPEIVLTISDDGAGIDTAAVLAKAVQTGLVESGEKPDEAGLLAMVFMPGFSTSQSVDGVSGRGVGLDAVKDGIERLGGDVRVETSPGQGSAFMLRAPLPLSLLDCLRVGVGGERYFLPIECVEHCLEGFPASAGAGPVSTVSVQGAVLPCFLLGELFELPAAQKKAGHLVVARHGGERFVLAVDEVLGLAQVLVKPLEGRMVEQECFIGAAPDEDGSMSLIMAPGFFSMLVRGGGAD
ncbi:MAG: two-component system chemotaxis family sensor kinase [Desulfovibrionaceae bacterium]|nr:MAG: two-component system chemotaxis family sensor kinase [Desulfovibrionaceae bacterium]